MTIDYTLNNLGQTTFPDILSATLRCIQSVDGSLDHTTMDLEKNNNGVTSRFGKPMIDYPINYRTKMATIPDKSSVFIGFDFS